MTSSIDARLASGWEPVQVASFQVVAPRLSLIAQPPEIDHGV